MRTVTLVFSGFLVGGRLHHAITAADDGVGRNHAFNSNLTIASVLWRPGGVPCLSHQHVFAKRTGEGRIGGAYEMHQEAER